MFRRDNFRTVVIGVLLSAAPGAVLPAAGAEYRLEPSVYLRSFYDDNLLLRNTGKTKTFGMEFRPGVTASASSETWRYELDTSLSFINMEDEQFDSDDQDIAFSAIHVTPTTSWQFLGQLVRASTRTTDLETAGVVDPEAQRRDAQTFRPVMQWTLNPLNQLVFGVTVQNVHYNALSFEDYDVYGGDIKWARQISEKTVLELTGFGSLYKSESFKSSCAGVFFATESGEFESETYGLQLGFSHQPNARLNFGASVGRREVASSAVVRTCLFGNPFFDGAASENDGLVLDANIEYEGEAYRIAASLSRSVSPVGLGFLIESTDLSVRGEYRLSETLTGRMTLSAYDNEAVDSSVQFAREGIRIQPSISWRVSEQWKLDGGIRYRTRDSLTGAESKGVNVFVGATYDFKPWVVSR